MGRPRLFKEPLTNAEKSTRWRARRAAKLAELDKRLRVLDSILATSAAMHQPGCLAPCERCDLGRKADKVIRAALKDVGLETMDVGQPWPDVFYGNPNG